MILDRPRIDTFSKISRDICIYIHIQWSAKDWHIFEILSTSKMCQSLTDYCTYLTTVKNIKNLEYYALEFGCYTYKTRLAVFFSKKIPYYSFQEMVSSFWDRYTVWRVYRILSICIYVYCIVSYVNCIFVLRFILKILMQ